MELDGNGGGLLFQVLTEREEQNAIAIASDDSFSGWTETFTEPRLCVAIVDRLTFGGNIIETGTTSYRLVHSRGQRATGGPSRALPSTAGVRRPSDSSSRGIPCLCARDCGGDSLGNRN